MTLKIKCDINKANISNLHIYWEKDNRHIRIMKGQRLTRDRNDIVINNIMPADQGIYKCFLSMDEYDFFGGIGNLTVVGT